MTRDNHKRQKRDRNGRFVKKPRLTDDGMDALVNRVAVLEGKFVTLLATQKNLDRHHRALLCVVVGKKDVMELHTIFHYHASGEIAPLLDRVRDLGQCVRFLGFREEPWWRRALRWRPKAPLDGDLLALIAVVGIFAAMLIGGALS